MVQQVWRVWNWLENVLVLQAVCVLVSSPILYFWRMPNSYCAAVGNIIFAPFMGAFIFLCALMFFCALFNLYPQLLYSFFEKLVQGWSWCLNRGSVSWLFIPNLLTVACWAGGVFGLAWLLKNRVVLPKIKHFLVVWLVIFSCCNLLQAFWPAKEQKLSKYGKSICCTFTKKGVVVCDQGVFNRLAKPEKFIFYELRPFLLEHFHCLTIHKLILPNSGERCLRAAQCCQKLLKCEEIAWAR